MPRNLRLSLTLALFGVLLCVVGVAVGEPDVETEGAYFDRSVGDDASAVFSKVGPGLLSPSDGNLWLGGGIALLVAAIGVAAASRRKGAG